MNKQEAEKILDEIIKNILTERTLYEWTDNTKDSVEIVLDEDDQRKNQLVKNCDFKKYPSLAQNACSQLKYKRQNGDRVNSQIIAYSSLCEDRQDCLRFVERHFSHENSVFLRIHRGGKHKNEFWLSAMVRFMLAPPPNTAYDENTPVEEITKFKYNSAELRDVLDEETDPDDVTMIHDLMHVYSIMGNDINHLPVKNGIFSYMDTLESCGSYLSQSIQKECLVLGRNTSLVQWYNAKDESAAYNNIAYRSTKPALQVYGVNKTRSEVVLHDTYSGICKKSKPMNWKYLTKEQEDIVIEAARERNVAVSDSFHFTWTLPTSNSQREHALKNIIDDFHYDNIALKNISKTHVQLEQEANKAKRKRAAINEEIAKWAVEDKSSASAAAASGFSKFSNAGAAGAASIFKKFKK